MGRWRVGFAIGAALSATLCAGARAQEEGPPVETPTALSKRMVGPHEVSQARTWSMVVTLEPCGNVEINRIDQYALDGAPEQQPIASPNQRKVLQWTVHGVVDRNLTLGNVLVEMSQRRYVFRVWYRSAGKDDVRFLYFSPYGAAAERIPPLPPEAVHDQTLLFRWKSLHAWSPRSPLNPERNAFDHFFPRLLRHLDSRMELPITFAGPGCETKGRSILQP